MDDILFHTKEYNICLTLLFYAINWKNTSQALLNKVHDSWMTAACSIKNISKYT